MPEIKESEDVMLLWNVLNTEFDSPNKCLSKHSGRVDFNFPFPRFLGCIKVHETGYFLPQMTTICLKNCITMDVLATFNLDLADYANRLRMSGRLTFIGPE